MINPTDFLGQTLVRHLARDGWKIYALSHADERPAVEALRRRLAAREEEGGGSDLEVLWGDPVSVGAGLDSRTIDAISREVDTIFNCPPLMAGDRARYAAVLDSVVKGTDQVISLAHRFPNLKALAQVSTVFVSGNYSGRFYEDWLDVGQSFYVPLHRNHFVAETKLRSAARALPVVVLRCGLLVGEAETGECREGEGLLPFFAALSRYARAVPRPMPLLAPDSEHKILAFTPNDYCARAILKLVESPESLGRTFCLVDPAGPSVRSFVDAMGDLMGRTCYRLSVDMLYKMPFMEPLFMVEWMSYLAHAVKRSSLPLRFLFQRGDYDTTGAKQLLAGSAVACPPFTEYLERLYRYYLTRYA